MELHLIQKMLLLKAAKSGRGSSCVANMQGGNRETDKTVLPVFDVRLIGETVCRTNQHQNRIDNRGKNKPTLSVLLFNPLSRIFLTKF